MTKHSSTVKMIAIIAAMLYILAVLSDYSFHSYAAEVAAEEEAIEGLQQLSTRDAIDLVSVNEEANLPGAQMARQTVNEHELRVEEERIEEQKKEKERRKKLLKKRKLDGDEDLVDSEAKAIARKNTEKTANGAREKWNGRKLSRSAGAIQGPSGRETYYNLNMSGVIRIMRAKGFSEKDYPYKVRADGVKTFGGYVMVAANLDLRPKGTLIETSVGTGIVVDTGGFARRNRTQLDIATNW